MWLAYARGNRDLKTGESGEQIGNSVLYSGPVLSTDEPERTSKARKLSKNFGQIWGNEYHTYTLLWRPGNIYLKLKFTHFYLLIYFFRWY